MAKGKKELAIAPILSDEVDSPQLQQAKIDAISDEVLTLRELVDLLKEENTALKEEVAELHATTTRVANSASIAPPKPAPPVRPVVEIGGERYQFKTGEVRLDTRRVVSSTAIAGDEDLLNEVFGKFPGMFTKL